MRHALSRTCLMIAAILGVAGCNSPSDGLPRQAISGDVKLDGQPIAAGTITFVPVGFEGPPVGAAIQDGSYSIPANNGPIPGNHRVEIYRRMPSGKTSPDPDDPAILIEEQFETIPSGYNLKSELKADVKQGGANNFPFELTGEIKTPPPKSSRKKR